jgi:predicted metal-dependent peptidase
MMKGALGDGFTVTDQIGGNMTAQVKIDQARWWAITNQPFYGSLAMSLGDVIDPSIQTAATDGKVIRWSPDYVETLTDQEVRFILLHETLHCAHQHLWRLPATSKGNEAGDHEINLTLQGIPGIEMPQGGLADPQYQGLSCEEILGRLPKDEDDEQGGGSGGSGGEDGQQQEDSSGGSSPDSGGQQQDGAGDGKPDPCGSFTAPKQPEVNVEQGPSPEELRDEWENRVIQANQAAQAMGQGTIPGDMERLLERMRHQQIDWRREMSDFVRDAMSVRNDWSRAARRHAWQPVLYPRKRSDELGKIVFARDTSGSVSDDQLSTYSALITDCLAETGCSGLVLDADRVIQDEIELAPGDECPLKAKGGGGTDFRPVFNRVEEIIAMGEPVAGIVYITDLYGPAPDTSEIPTLWIATTNQEGPFGRTVHI